MFILGDINFDGALKILRKASFNPDCLELIGELPKTMTANSVESIVVEGFAIFIREYSYVEVKAYFPPGVLLKPEVNMDNIPMCRIKDHQNEFYLFLYMVYQRKGVNLNKNE